MKALIFGCGYLGKRVATTWMTAGHEVSAVTRSPQRAQQLKEVGLRTIVADVCEPNSLKDLPDADIILYAVGFDRNSGRSHEEVTCGGPRNVLSCLSARYSRFIYISSTSVYGQSAGEWVDETSDCQPTQPGGALNLATEKIVQEHFLAHSGATHTILRLAGIYGPDRLLSRIESLQLGTPIAGRSDSWLNLVHVDDAASAVHTCATDALPQPIYNVVDDRPIQRGEYFEQLARLVGASQPTFDSTNASSRGSGGLNKRCSNRRIRELGWTPFYPSIETGLPAAVQASNLQRRFTE